MITVCAYNVKSYFKAELERHCTKKRLQEINNGEQNTIFKTYAVFKEKHCLETYIQCLSLKKYQQTICRFRVSSNRLGIELVNIINRVCQWDKPVISAAHVV